VLATKAVAVGTSVPSVGPGAGALPTLWYTNRSLGPAILDALARGLSPEAAIESALAGDAGRGIRQVHAVDRHGRTAAWTGQNCVHWCGSVAAPGISVAGNMLSGEPTVAETLATFQAHPDLEPPERMMLAMEAGEAAGGDRRGRQSAAMVLITTEDFPDLNLRVDDSPDPLPELRRLLGIWRRERAPGLATQPSRANPAGFTDLDAIEASWIARGMDL